MTGRGKCDVSIACCGNGVYAIYKKEELNIDMSWALLRGGVLFDKRRGSRASWVGEKVGRKWGSFFEIRKLTEKRRGNSGFLLLLNVSRNVSKNISIIVSINVSILISILVFLLVSILTFILII